MRELTGEQARRALAATVSESSWERTVEEALIVTGHLVAHFRPARTQRGWRTAMSGHSGYPDITAISPDGRLKIAELKSLRGKTTPEQRAWLDRFREAGALVAVLRPGQSDELAAFVLAGRLDPVL